MGQMQNSNILLTWEFGEDLGHIARLRPVAAALRELGHRVFFASSKFRGTNRLPPWLDVLPAPALPTHTGSDRIREPATFADVLFNSGFTDAQALAGAVRAWRGLFGLVRPDAVVLDYSPLALLALQGTGIPSLLLGTGFACPPDQRPLPDIRAWQNHYPERMRMTEDAVLAALNRQLVLQDQPELGSVGALFERADANCLATFPELDHYPGRSSPKAEYVGVWSELGGDAPAWPDGEGPRVFAYLKPFRGLPKLLDHLVASGLPCLVFLPASMDVGRWQSETLSVVDQPLDMDRVTAECDLAILHAGHGSTARMLLAGKPILQLPFNVEQHHTAENTERLGAGLAMRLDQPMEEILAGFDRLAREDAFRQSAQAFAARYRAFNSQEAMEGVVRGVLALARG